jgi:hydroxyacylglutathione hydrolase
MFFKQFYDQPLAQASYMIGCQATGDAIVVDPLRDVQPYLDVAAAEGLRISHVTETHIHADFVSGARELASRTGAQLYLSAEGGEDWQYAFADADRATLLRDGDVITVGNITLDVLHTPGHTPEHLSFVVTDHPAGAGAMGILTGDFVFVGDVGRPDLLEKAAGVKNTMEAGARTLFHSLERFRALPDHLQVWPGHGAGSACGKALGAVPSSTVGYEKRANWGVGTTNEHDFVTMVLEGQPEPPAYFAQMKRINRDGPRVLGGIHAPPLHTSAELLTLADARAWIVDVRAAAAFAAGHIPSTLSIPYGRSFTTWAGWLLPYDADIYLLTDESEIGDLAPAVVRDAVRDLALIGLDRVVGWFDAAALAGFEVAGRTLESVPQLDAATFAARREPEALHLIDVRGATEFDAGHLPASVNIPVGLLAQSLDRLPEHAPVVVQCQSGARSAIAASVLLRAGRRNIFNLIGGFEAWRRAGLPVERTAGVLV